MQLLNLTLDTPAENLALDEALLEEAEAGNEPRETLRLWQSAEPFVVIGRASRVDVEVNRKFCDARGIPVLRRCSGGAAIVTGPGCLMYAVVLSRQLRPQVQMISEAHRLVMGVMTEAIGRIAPGVESLGTNDLSLGNLKFSGNALRCKRTHILYHGTLLYDFPLDLVSDCLLTPPRQPEYRQGRDHDAFVRNLDVSVDELRNTIISGWQATSPRAEWPELLTQELVRERYLKDEWNFRL